MLMDQISTRRKKLVVALIYCTYLIKVVDMLQYIS